MDEEDDGVGVRRYSGEVLSGLPGMLLAFVVLLLMHFYDMICGLSFIVLGIMILVFLKDWSLGDDGSSA